MIRDLTRSTLSSVRNPEFRAYAERYVKIYEDFLSQVEQMGIALSETEEDPAAYADAVAELTAGGATARNDHKSVYHARIAPACLACQTGAASATFFFSLKCHRNCFFCFNPNQENYEYFREHTQDAAAQLEQTHARREALRHVALTGGEPLLDPAATLRFFETARRLYPKVDARLYTSGDHVTAELLDQLRQAGLDEIRFSIRLADLEHGSRRTLENIRLAAPRIPRVMVEMPVLPGSVEEMKGILVELDQAGVFGINLLELCFPFNNVEEFNRRGYRVKRRPFRVLYDYWYAGGLPIAGSESACLELLRFARDARLNLGVHYCSLENKHTGQVYRQNKGAPERLCRASERDYFLKSAKVFGDDVALAQKEFKKKGFDGWQYLPEHRALEFPLRKLRLLTGLSIEVGVSTQIMEVRSGEKVLRELKIDWTTPQLFDPAQDI